jgi:hypothetical protein
MSHWDFSASPRLRVKDCLFVTVLEKGKPVRYMAVESSEEVRRNVFCRNYGD